MTPPVAPVVIGMLGRTSEDLEGVEDVNWRNAETVEERRIRLLDAERTRLAAERVRLEAKNAAAIAKLRADERRAREAAEAAAAAAAAATAEDQLAALDNFQRRLKRLNMTSDHYREGRERARPFWINFQSQIGSEVLDDNYTSVDHSLSKYLWQLPIRPGREADNGSFLHFWSGPVARLRFIWRRIGLRSDIGAFKRMPQNFLSDAEMLTYYTMVSKLTSWELIWDKLTYDVIGPGAGKPWNEKHYIIFLDVVHEIQSLFANSMRYWPTSSPQYEAAVRIADSVDYQMNLMHVEEWEMAWSERIADVDPETATTIKPRYSVPKLTRCSYLLSDIVASPYARFLVNKEDMPSDTDPDYRRIVSENGGERMCLDEIRTKLDAGGYSSNNPYTQLRRDLGTCFRNAIRYHRRSRSGFDPAARLGPGMTHNKARAMAQMCLTVYVDGWKDDPSLDRVGQLSRLSILEKLEDSTQPPRSLASQHPTDPNVDARRRDLFIMLDLLETLSDDNRGRLGELLILEYPEAVTVGDDGLHRSAEVNIEKLSWSILRVAFSRLSIPFTPSEAQQGSGESSSGAGAGGMHSFDGVQGSNSTADDERFKQHAITFLNRETQRRQNMAKELKQQEDARRREAALKRQQDIEQLRRQGAMPMDDRS